MHPILPYGIMALNALVAALLCMLLPETRFKPTLETMEKREESTREEVEKQEESGNSIKA